MGARGNKFQISQINELLQLKFYLCFHKSYEIWNLFFLACVAADPRTRVNHLKSIEKV